MLSYNSLYIYAVIIFNSSLLFRYSYYINNAGGRNKMTIELFVFINTVFVCLGATVIHDVKNWESQGDD